MRKRLILVGMAALMVLTAGAQWKYEWQNPKLPTAQRVESLLGMLTPEEKVGLMMKVQRYIIFHQKTK